MNLSKIPGGQNNSKKIDVLCQEQSHKEIDALKLLAVLDFDIVQ